MKILPVRRETINIAAVEDDPIRLVGLRSILDSVPDFHLTGMTTSELATGQTIDIILLGNHTGLKFFETMATLKVACPNMRIIVTGSSASDETMLSALGCGAKGYVHEGAPATELIQAIQTVHRGLVWAPRRVMSMFIERSGDLLRRNSQPGRSPMTAREKQVLDMLVEGRSNKEIGGPLGIKERTVKAHLAKLMRKAGVHNRIALSVHAVNRSLVAAQ